jgi:hypothetical protein
MPNVTVHASRAAPACSDLNRKLPSYSRPDSRCAGRVKEWSRLPKTSMNQLSTHRANVVPAQSALCEPRTTWIKQKTSTSFAQCAATVPNAKERIAALRVILRVILASSGLPSKIFETGECATNALLLPGSCMDLTS